MDYSKLEKNIIDVLREEQLKLGYRSEDVRLYYPLQSLNRFLKTNYGISEMAAELRLFSGTVEDRLGRIGISNENDRFCILLPPQASDFVHEHMDNEEFICDFVNTVARHGVSMDEVLEQFYKYSDNVHVEKTEHGEFDYFVYFEDDLVFSKDGDVIWQCANCGHICVGKKAPEVCPVFSHPQSYFQVKADNY